MITAINTVLGEWDMQLWVLCAEKHNQVPTVSIPLERTGCIYTDCHIYFPINWDSSELHKQGHQQGHKQVFCCDGLGKKNPLF